MMDLIASHRLIRLPFTTQSVVAILNDISAAIKKLRTVFVFFAGWPTYRGEEAAPSRQAQHNINTNHERMFLLVIQALFLGF